ncbi:MAG: DUF116 domain-containing protein [Prolixibacteraceae bacterium]|nr:DUF116 domain-containing protein [Prolixibacteraceae bacterium]
MKTQNLFQYGGNGKISAYPTLTNRSRTVNTETLCNTLENLVDKVLDEGKKRFENLIEQCQGSLNYYTHPMIQTVDDGILDLLIISVLWDVNNGKWGNSSYKNNERLFNKLMNLKLEYPTMTSGVERLRSKLARRVLDNPGFSTGEKTLENLKLLCMWLTATNEFNEEVMRFYPWISFFESVPRSFVELYLNEIDGFAKWFEKEARHILGNYHSNLTESDATIEQEAGLNGRYRDNKDDAQCYLNMVGTFLINRKMKRDFFGSKHQILFLPEKMTGAKKCQSVEILKGHICSNCTSNCYISNISNQMKERGIYTFIIQNGSSITNYLKKWANQKEVGVIGSAHVAGLLSVALEMKRLNLPAQCVVLINGLYEEQLFGRRQKSGFETSSVKTKKQVLAFA